MERAAVSLLAVQDIPSIPALLAARAEATPDGEALRSPAARGSASMTWSQVATSVRRAAAGLRAIGVTDEDRVALLSATSAEWVIADLAILTAGCATSTIYPSNTPDECAFIIGDSGSRVVVVGNGDQLEKIHAIRATIPQVLAVVIIDGAGDGDWVLSLDQLHQRSDRWLADRPTGIDEIVAGITSDRLASVIYTSGTTGRPKGVELLHDSWLYAAAAAAKLRVLTAEDVHFPWLPLSHAFGKVLEVVMIDTGVVSWVDGRVDRIVDNLAEIRPTVMAGAPRIFEKAHNAVVSTIRQDGGIKLAMFRWARNVALRMSRLEREGERVPPSLAVQHRLADALVLSKLRERFGGRIRAFVSGSAPLAAEIIEFFTAAGMPVLEGYGLTESAAGSCINPPGAAVPGTVGPPLPGTEVRIADDGEVLLRSRGVMRGYHGLPAETAAVLRDGWLRTGDIGELDHNGYLRITDRKKELIKTSGGKYIAPTVLEGQIKAASPYVSQVLMHGERRNYVTALITLDPDAIARWAAGRDLPALADTEEVRQLLQDALDDVNARLARHETIKRFAVLGAEFAVDTGELTASLKVRRRVVEERHAGVLDMLYADAIDRV